MYLAKYVAKTEPSFQLDISKDASDTEKYIRTRDVGRLEVDHINLGRFLCCASRQVIYLPTDLNPAYGFLKRKRDLPHNPDSEDVFCSNLLDQLENVLYVDWAEKYMLQKEGAKRKPRILAQVQEHFFHKIFCQFFRPIFLKQSRRSRAPAQWHVTSNARAPSQ